MAARDLVLNEELTDSGYINTYTVTNSRGNLVVRVQLEYCGDAEGFASSWWIVRVDRGRGYGRPKTYKKSGEASARVMSILERAGAVAGRAK